MGNRLIQHSVRFRMNGLPIFGSGLDVDGWDEDEIKGYVNEPEWQWSDLTDEEQAEIHTEAADLVTRSTERTPDNPMTIDSALGYIIGHHGVTCPHRWVNHEPTFRECRICLRWEQLPGIVVHVDGQTLRVSDPPPRILRIPRPPDLRSDYLSTDFGSVSSKPDALQVDEYEWDGHGYRLVR